MAVQISSALKLSLGIGSSPVEFGGFDHGPFIDGNDNLYIFAVVDDTQPEPVQAWKSTDDGANWSSVDSANSPTWSTVAGSLHIISGVAAVQVGTVIHVAFVTTPNPQDMFPAIEVRYATFHTSDDGGNPDTWQLDEQVATAGIATASDGGVGIRVRSDGDVLVAHRIPDEQIMGTDHARVGYSRREGGTWTSNVTAPSGIAGVGASSKFAGMVDGSSDGTHFIYWDGRSTSGARAFTIDSSNSQSTPIATGISRSPDGQQISFGSGPVKVLISSLNGDIRRVEEDGSGNLQLETGQSATSSGLFAGSHGFGRDTTDGEVYAAAGHAAADLFYTSSTEGDGGDWGTPVEIENGVTFWSGSATFFERGGGRYLGIVWYYDDANNLIEGVYYTELEIAAGGTAHTEAATDDAGVTDDTSKTVDLARPATDDAGVTDQAVQAVTSFRTVTEAAGVTDTTEKVSAVARAVDETVGISDQTAAAKTVQVSISESVGVDDSTARTAAAVRTVSDGAGASDATVKTSTLARSISDDGGISDVVAETVEAGATEEVTDPAGISDTTIRTATAARSVTDQAGAADSTTPARAIARTVDESAGVSDGVDTAQTAANQQQVDDDAGISDSTARTTGTVRAVTDPAGVADSTTPARQIVRTVTDAAGVSDTVTEQTTGADQQAVTENVGASDTVQAAVSATRTVTDQAGVDDSTDPAKSAPRSVTEQAGISDTTARQHDAGREVTEPAQATDSTVEQVSGAGKETVTDQASVSDSVNAAGDTVRAVTEQAGISDSPDRTLDTTRTHTDQAGASDSTDTAKTIRVEVTSSVGVGDTTGKASTAARAVSEAVTADDQPQRDTITVRVAAEGVEAGDQTLTAVDVTIEITDTAGVADSTADNLFEGVPLWWVPIPVAAQPNPIAVTRAPVPFQKNTPDNPPT